MVSRVMHNPDAGPSGALSRRASRPPRARKCLHDPGIAGHDLLQMDGRNGDQLGIAHQR